MIEIFAMLYKDVILDGQAPKSTIIDNPLRVVLQSGYIFKNFIAALF